MGRPRKITSPTMLEKAFEEYKKDCDNRMVTVHEFSQKNAKFVSQQLKKRVSYKIEGFCKFLHLSRSAFYDTYENDDRYSDIVTRVKEECEVDAVEKFETGELPPQLAGLLLSRYGYSTKTDTEVSGITPVIISGGDDLED